MDHRLHRRLLLLKASLTMMRQGENTIVLDLVEGENIVYASMVVRLAMLPGCKSLVCILRFGSDL